MEQKALKTVKNYMWWSMGAGLIPVPFVDLFAVTGVQLKMLADLSKVYGVEFHENRGKAFVGALMGFIVPSAVTFGSIGSALKAIPVLGLFVGVPSMALFSGATAYAVGRVFIQHFESGGTFLTFDPDKVKDYFKQQFEEGAKVAANMGEAEESGTAA